MRVSNYIISSHVSDNEYMLIHGYSGAIDLVSSEFHTKLMMALKQNRVNPDIFGSEEYQQLIDRKYITDKSPEEEFDY